ncbi:aspartate racemase [Fusarium acutatum]|uniref:Aspartate racemase n=1 Tax=Fusarium acutatum TaxID=78861 RepID=A0A8H4NDJ2_9HYPO|nr:aspartate racemase [Fusarium acutatum]
MARENTDSGPPLGFLAVEVDIHRPPGDPFNQDTWPFPLIREKVTGTSEAQIVTNGDYEEDFIDRFVQATIRLAEKGAVGAITSCGFLAAAQTRYSDFQPHFVGPSPAEHVRLAALSPIPVATSALVQVPSLLAIFPVSRPIGVLTYDSARLGSAHLLQLGIDPDRVRVQGLSDDSHLREICARGASYDADRLERELVAEAKLLIRQHPDISAVVLECTNMPPYADRIQDAIQLPVYDVYTMGLWFYSGLTRRNPSAWKASDTRDTCG